MSFLPFDFCGLCGRLKEDCRCRKEWSSFWESLWGDQTPEDFFARCRQAAARGRLYLGEARDGPIEEDLKTLTTGLVSVGDSGTGKSVHTLDTLVVQPVATSTDKTETICFVDCKSSDPYPSRVMAAAASKFGWKFRYFSTGAEPSHALNPVENLAETCDQLSDFSEALTFAFQIGKGYPFYEGRSQDAVERLLTYYPSARTFTQFAKALGDSESPIYADRRAREDMVGLAQAIRHLAPIRALNVARNDTSVPPEVQKNAIRLVDLIEEGGYLVYFRFPRHYGLARALLRIIRDAVRRVNERHQKRERRRVFLIVDEAHRIAGGTSGSVSAVEEIISMGRDLKIFVALLLQGYAQVRIGADDQLLKLVQPLPTVYWGTTDGGSTNKDLAHEFEKEVREDHEGGTTSYRTEPGIAYDDLEWLCTNPKARGHFLFRVPRSKSKTVHRWGNTLHAFTLEEYEALDAQGWPAKEELPGSVVTDRYDFFGEREARQEEKPQADPGLREAIRKAYETAKKGGSNGNGKTARRSKRKGHPRQGNRRGGGKAAGGA